jgi:phosphate/sulfate permease
MLRSRKPLKIALKRRRACLAKIGVSGRPSTVCSIAMAWVPTLPAAMAIAGGLYFILRQFL